jgi:mycofactocin precursor
VNALQLEETGEPRAAEEDVTAEALIEAHELVEKVSIDGMCGVC